MTGFLMQYDEVAEEREDLAWFYSRDGRMSLERARADVDRMTDAQVDAEWHRLADEGEL